MALWVFDVTITQLSNEPATFPTKVGIFQYACNYLMFPLRRWPFCARYHAYIVLLTRRHPAHTASIRPDSSSYVHRDTNPPAVTKQRQAVS